MNWMLVLGIVVFAIGAALWMLGREQERRQRSEPPELTRNGSQIVVAQAVRLIALWLALPAAAIGVFGYLFDMRDVLSILLILFIIVFAVGFLRALGAFFQDRPQRYTDDKYTLNLSDGTTIPLTLHIEWQLPRSLAFYNHEKVGRDVRARIAEWFVSFKFDPPQTEQDARALIKNVNAKLSEFLVPAVLPYGSYLDIRVTDVTLPSAQKYPGIIIGVSE